MNNQTIAEMFIERTKISHDKIANIFKIDGKWKSATYGDVRREVTNLAAGLVSIGVQKGDRVAILASNRPQWAYADYAIACLGGVSVTIYPTLTADSSAYILNDSKSKIIFVENAEQSEKVRSVESQIPTLEKVIVMDNDVSGGGNEIGFLELQNVGKEQEDFDLLEKTTQVTQDDLLTLIYTSGTTGNPKGVMLTHKNLCTNIIGGLSAIDVLDGDRFLSFLPLSHSFERMVGHFTSFWSGAEIAYAQSLETVAEDMIATSPTIMAAMPRLFEKVYAKMLNNVEKEGGLKKKIFNWAIDVGKNSVKTGKKGFKFAIADKLVFSKLKAKLGGKLRFFVSGGAPLSQSIGEFFEYANVLILEGYGLTETSPVLTCNRLEQYKFGTVGKPLANVEIKIADDGEILAKGPNIMKGYYNLPEKTENVFTEDDWFKTGDIGFLDDDDFLTITDRKKNLIVTSGGKNIAPQPMENALVLSPFIEQILVIGDKRNFISALIVPSFEKIKSDFAEFADAPNVEIIKDEKIYSIVESDVNRLQAHFNKFEQVKKILLLPEEFSIENGMLTPTLKVKRKEAEQHYAEQIDQLYEAPIN
ncbi:MAG: long-chain fatty acid--CoA ligase [Candidatus Marinimicrobia bacterium]|nr:long-chain fatty acid--CoA ligase [Candidatus Neomarinimicrobiota bacterium]